MSFPRWLALALVGLLCLVGGAACLPGAGGSAEDDIGPVGEFRLTERSGRTVTNEDLLGKVWVASFQFTRCTSECPQISRTMHQLQDDLARRRDVVLVTFTVDPRRDTLDDLRAYAELHGADPERWLFLTGEEEEIRELMYRGFKLAKPTRSGADLMHSQKLVVVDRQGHVRGYYDGLRNPRWPDPEEKYHSDLRKLVRQVDELRLPAFMPRDVPRFNAFMNGISAGLLLLGYAAIRKRLVQMHALCMLTALAVSAVFLASYLYFHLVIKVGQPTRFTDQAPGAPEWVRHAYLGILLTHTVLAALAAPLALYTAYQGVRGRIRRHVRVARWTLPIWLYVSVTGVVVYWMLYRLYPAP
jgi:protein SCO1/2/putative membrane protein